MKSDTLNLLPPGPPPRFKSPDRAARLLKRHRLNKPAGVQTVTISCDEFTSVCPATSQPDFSRVSITYRPRSYILESKAVKAYLWSYREHGALCEDIARMVAADVMAALDAERVEATVKQASRGGIVIEATAAFDRVSPKQIVGE